MFLPIAPFAPLLLQSQVESLPLWPLHGPFPAARQMFCFHAFLRSNCLRRSDGDSFPILQQGLSPFDLGGQFLFIRQGRPVLRCHDLVRQSFKRVPGHHGLVLLGAEYQPYGWVFTLADPVPGNSANRLTAQCCQIFQTVSGTLFFGPHKDIHRVVPIPEKCPICPINVRILRLGSMSQMSDK